MQLPGGASVARTTEVITRSRGDPARGSRWWQDITSVVGLNFIDNYSQSNAAFIVVTLKAVRRTQGRCAGVAASSAGSVRNSAQIQGGRVVPLAPPPIIGLGTGGGFTYVLQDLRGGDPKALAQALRGSSSPPTRIRN